MATITFSLTAYCIHFILRRELVLRQLDFNFKFMLNPMIILLPVVFISETGFFICETLFYSHLYPRAGYGLLFFFAFQQVSIAWFSWLRSKSVVSLHFSQQYIKVITTLLAIAPFIYTLPCIIQFLPILNSVQYASIPLGIGISLLVNIDINCLIAYTKLLFSLTENKVETPQAYRVIAKYTAISTIFRLFGFTFYTASSFIKSETTATTLVILQDLCLLADVTGLLLMKIKLTQPGFFDGSGESAKKKVKDFLGGTASGEDVTQEGSSAKPGFVVKSSSIYALDK
ncbi:UNVERIFIED_CONTAM: hypothetical protein HDU68_006545 [Siphonaria sp. JEL0065]|nr:hypothetical protein HDU68_006545 [Siphonaria sp. JEL0065]